MIGKTNFWANQRVDSKAHIKKSVRSYSMLPNVEMTTNLTLSKSTLKTAIKRLLVKPFNYIYFSQVPT